MKLSYDNAVFNFSEAFSLSKKETSKGNEYIPGGFSRKTFGYGPHAVFVSHGEGQYIHTIDGQRLLDLNNNFSTNVLGHNHETVINAMNEVISKGFSFGNPMDYEIELAKILSSRVKSIEQVKFFCSASEACLGAIRIARGYTGKKKLLSLKEAIMDLRMILHSPLILIYQVFLALLIDLSHCQTLVAFQNLKPKILLC